MADLESNSRIPSSHLHFLLLSFPKGFCKIRCYQIRSRFVEDLFECVFREVYPVADLEESFQVSIHELTDGFGQDGKCLFLRKNLFDFRQKEVFGDQTEGLFVKALAHLMEKKALIGVRAEVLGFFLLFAAFLKDFRDGSSDDFVPSYKFLNVGGVDSRFVKLR